MKAKIVFYNLLCLLLSINLNAQEGQAITGQWQDAKHPEKQLEIYEQEQLYFGKSINEKDANKNGRLILDALKWIEKSDTYQGTIIDPDKGWRVALTIQMLDRDTFQFTIGRFLFKKTFTFKRIQR